MSKRTWPHHISCGCQACDLHRQAELPELTERGWLRVIRNARRAR